jgi:hypothetical protein
MERVFLHRNLKITGLLKIPAILIAAVFFTSQIIACSPADNPVIWDGNQFYGCHNILRVSSEPLFMANGEINQGVLENLYGILSDPMLDPLLRRPKTGWPGGISYSGPAYREITAEDFSRFIVPAPVDFSESGVIVIKLFETIPNRTGVRNAYLTELTSQWWQLVYRSADDNRDVLTLWMAEPYRRSVFGGNRFDAANRSEERYLTATIQGARTEQYRWHRIPAKRSNTIRDDYSIEAKTRAQNSFFFENNYSASIVRENLLRDADNLFKHFDVERFLTPPGRLPGSWQSSYSQTGQNAFGRYYATEQFYTTSSEYHLAPFPGSENPLYGLGAAGLIWGHWAHFSLINGKDGLSVGPYNSQWRNTQVGSTYEDLLWLPSDFEVRSMGHDKDNARFQTFLRYYGDETTVLRTNTEPETRPDFAFGRSGLWRLNGFDRAFFYTSANSARVWLRSVDNLGIGNANTIDPTGNRYGHGIINVEGVRPALHLTLSDLFR